MKFTWKVACLGLSTIVIYYIIYLYYIHNTRDQANIRIEQRYYQHETNEKPYQEDPCKRISEEKPVYYGHGTRISVQKCFEYIWEKIETEKCIEYRGKSLFGFGILGGYITTFGEFPHMGALGWKANDGNGWSFHCGATIISAKFMLTAGHCTYDPQSINKEPKIVRLGVTNVERSSMTPKDIYISEIIKHPNYTPPKRYNDIALLKLEKEIIFDANIHPACLWSEFRTPKQETKPVASGWGATKNGEKRTSAELRAVELSLIDDSHCDRLLKIKRNRNWLNGLSSSQICAGELRGGLDTCEGDSGGPLQIKINLSTKGKMYYIIGVTSFGYHCGYKNTPGVYTRVSSFVDWIENIVWKEEIATRNLNYNEEKFYFKS